VLIAFLVLLVIFVGVLAVCFLQMFFLYWFAIGRKRQLLPAQGTYDLSGGNPFAQPRGLTPWWLDLPTVLLIGSGVLTAFACSCAISPLGFKGGIAALPFLLGAPTSNDEAIGSALVSILMAIGIAVFAAITLGTGWLALGVRRLMR
jgi:hypothetical protein